MEKASEVLYGLKPVRFRYNREYDATQTLAFGLIAEEVAEVAPDLVGRNPKGEPESSATSKSMHSCSTNFSKSTKRSSKNRAKF
jgi:hypothetical protein